MNTPTPVAPSASDGRHGGNAVASGELLDRRHKRARASVTRLKVRRASSTSAPSSVTCGNGWSSIAARCCSSDWRSAASAGPG